jgi:hypothetical protein
MGILQGSSAEFLRAVLIRRNAPGCKLGESAKPRGKEPLLFAIEIPWSHFAALLIRKAKIQHQMAFLVPALGL